MYTATSKDHYFNKSNEQYKQDTIATIEQLKLVLSKQKLHYLLETKLQLRQPIFNENQFLLEACEISAASSIYTEYPQGYIYERQQNQNKDVDFSFISENIRFNVEVKCFNYKKHSTESPSLTLLGPQLDTCIYQQMAANNPGLRLERSRLLNIVNFFQNSKDKFVEHSKDEYNILMISCYDISDYIDVLTCIAGDFGISFGKNKEFRERNNGGNLDVNDFKIIDAIVVNNLGHLHHTCHQEDVNSYINPWKYRHSFSLGIQLHEEHESRTKDTIGLVFKKAFNLYNDSYSSFCSNSELDRGSYSESLPRYINSLRKQGGHYFL